jgi:simple sugar transport system ATP-binding protein
VTETARVEVRLGARRVTRTFGSVVANDRVDLSVAPATIHAIVGGNGAGKSTLMRILQGVDQPDEGSVILDDHPVRLAGPADAYARGIGMVHQEFMLAPPLTLLENLVLAREPVGFGGLIDWRAAQADADRLAQIAGVTIDWRLRVVDAPLHVRQALEILRLLYRGADVLILDEPTAVLAPEQIQDLLALMRKLKAEGRTILFINHKLEEVMSVADAITIMRGGRVVETTSPAKTSLSELGRAMVGEPIEPAKIEIHMRGSTKPLFSARGLVGLDAMGVRRLGPVDIDVFPGEIVGVAGVGGNGQDELVSCAAGLTPPAKGTIAFAAVDMTRAATSHFRATGVGYLSADRGQEGLCLTASIRDNFIAGRERDRAFSRLGVLRLRAIATEAERALARLNVRYGRLIDPASSLSGGNQQRLAITRELDREPRLLVAAQPTRGVDIAGTAFIHSQIAAFRDRGGAVLLISESLDEILTLSDRIIGLYNGRIVGEISRDQASVDCVGRMMLGQKAA